VTEVSWDALRREAEVAMRRAYAPYSHYPVGAALACADGAVVAGCNVENASFPAGICAERAAVASAVSQGRRAFARLALCTAGDRPAAPCGVCRQVLMEFAPQLEIVSFVPNGPEVRWTLADLLPAPFALTPEPRA
jgi:cytidine deaminase